MEVCTTLGMLSPEQARQLKEAGLTAYNHNLDTSREYYPKVSPRRPNACGAPGAEPHSSRQVVTTRKYDDRLDTLAAVREAGISVCSGGILGLGEDDGDRVGLIWEMTQCVRIMLDRHVLAFLTPLTPGSGSPRHPSRSR